MSTGGDPSGPRRSQEAEGEQTFADVLNAFSFGSTRRRRKTSGPGATPQGTAPDEREEAASSAPADQFGQAHRANDQPATWEPGTAERGAPAAAVRAYVWTGGRTRSHHHFEVETLVTATEPDTSTLTQPHHAVLGLCREPKSVAEVAALLAIPLGVAKVLLGDMADRGMIFVHEAATGVDDNPSPVLMERVLTGLRRL